MLYISQDKELLDTHTEEDLMEEAVKTNSLELNITVEKFVGYDEKHCEYYTETLEKYSVNLQEIYRILL